jgi:ABC-2 type transport system permease protein
VLRDDDPGISRYVGMAGAVFVVVGGMSLFMQMKYSKVAIGPGWSTLLLAVGLVGLLYHAAFDRDIQFRRIYMAFSYAAIAVGAILCLVPYPDNMGDQFPAGYLCLCLGLIFLLAYLRNEDDPLFCEWGQRVLLGGGAALLAVGLIGGNINSNFFLGMGVLFALLGLVYVSGFLGSRGASDDLGYYVGLGLGGVGAVVIVVAVIRSAFYPGETGAFFVPNGLLLMVLGLLAGLISLLFCSDATIVVLTRRELSGFFYSPLAYFVLFAFTAIAWWRYFQWLALLDSYGQPVPEPVVSYYFLSFLPIIVTIGAVPVLTMRLFSEEWRTGTLEVMLTVPVGEATVVLSKFFAAMLMFMLVWLPFGLFLVALHIMGGKSFDYRPMLSFGVVLLFVGSCFTSLGVLCSSLTRNQLVSGVLCFVGMLLFTGVELVRPTIRSPAILAILKHMNFISLWEESLQGKLIPPPLFFFASLTVLFLFVTVKVLEARKWV